MKPMPPLLEAMGVTDDHRPALPEGWMDRATQELVTAFKSGLLLCADDVRKMAEENGLPPAPDGRAWGTVFSRAKRKGWLVFVGRAHTHGKAPHRVVKFWRAA